MAEAATIPISSESNLAAERRASALLRPSARALAASNLQVGGTQEPKSWILNTGTATIVDQNQVVNTNNVPTTYWNIGDVVAMDGGL